MANVRTLSLNLLANISDFTKGLDNADKGLKKFGKQTEKLGKKMSLSLTAPIVAVGTAALKLSGDFEVSMASMQVNADATGEQMESLRKLAIKMGQDTVFSAGESADAMLELSKGGLSVANIEGGALAATMNLAATEGMALADAATIVVQSMNTFGLSAKDSTKAVDLLAAGAVASTAGVADLADGLKYVGSTAANLSIPMEDTVTALAALNNAGIDSTTAGTSLNRMLLGLIPTSRKAAEEAAALGLEFVKADGSLIPFEQIVAQLVETYGDMGDAARTASLKQVFGVEGMRAANIIIANGVKGYEELNAAVTKEGVAAELAAARQAGLNGSMEQLSGSVETATLALGDQLAPVIIKIADYVTALTNKFNGLTNGQKQFVTIVLAVIAAVGPLLIIIGKVSTGVLATAQAVSLFVGLLAKWEVATKLLAAAQWLLNIAMNANPIGLVVLAVAALVAGLVLAYKKIEPFRDLISDIVEKIKDMGRAIKDSALGKAIGSIVSKVTEGRAMGGTVNAGQAVRVGELGSEVFVPTSGGQIVPQNKLGGGGNTFIFNGVIDGESARRSIERVMQNSTRRTGTVNFAGSAL